jgi:hypothetical protein
MKTPGRHDRQDQERERDDGDRDSDSVSSHPIDRLAREMRDDPESREPPIDWSNVDAKLFDRVRAEIADDQATRHHRPRAVWLPVAAALALAAGVALFIGRAHDAPPLDDPGAVSVAPAESAGALVMRDGTGDVLVDGRAASVGTPLVLGSVIETHGARALFERGANAGKVAFWIEANTRARVASVRGALVIALDGGAVEAEVLAVARGEAFAVDVGAARVAVHGTHLRVARVARVAHDASNADRVAVDLTEGVVSIGSPPRVGSTFGELVTAPAHVEFAASDVKGTLRVDHALLAVRPAVSFAIVVPSPEAAREIPEPAPTSPGPGVVARPAAMRAPSPPAIASSAATPPIPAKAEPPRSQPEPAPPATVATVVTAPSSTPRSPLPPTPPMRERDPNAEETIAAGVRACLAARPPARDVAVVVSTVLELKVYDDGSVELARFVPPLAPEVQACAANVIYRTRFTRGGAISIPIEYKHVR